MPEIAVPTSKSIDHSHLALPKPSLRKILKDATAEDHARLDGRLVALDLSTIAGYRRFLEINADALLPLERALVDAGVHAILPAWRVHARTDAILNDLSRIGGRARPLPAPELRDDFAVLATLYVLEGSRLGAAYLLKTVKGASESAIAGATGYLGHGAGQHLWTHFLAVLESHADRVVEPDDLVFPARRAFALFAAAAERQ